MNKLTIKILNRISDYYYKVEVGNTWCNSKAIDVYSKELLQQIKENNNYIIL